MAIIRLAGLGGIAIASILRILLGEKVRDRNSSADAFGPSPPLTDRLQLRSHCLSDVDLQLNGILYGTAAPGLGSGAVRPWCGTLRLVEVSIGGLRDPWPFSASMRGVSIGSPRIGRRLAQLEPLGCVPQ